MHYPTHLIPTIVSLSKQGDFGTNESPLQMYTNGIGPQTPEHTVCTALLKKGPEIINEYIKLQEDDLFLNYFLFFLTLNAPISTKVVC